MRINWHSAFLPLLLVCNASIFMPLAQATTIVNGAVFDVSYNENQFYGGGGYGIAGTSVDYFPDFSLNASTPSNGTNFIEDIFKAFDIVAHPGYMLQSVTMNVFGYYDNYPDDTILMYSGSLQANGNSSNAISPLFGSFTGGAWSATAMVGLADTDYAYVNFYNSLSAFSSGVGFPGDANVSISNISFSVGVTPVPLPSAIILLLSGLFAMAGFVNTRRQAAN